MPRKKLKLYVWENVLTDWTSGMMVALAYDPDHARKVLRADCDYLPDEDLAKEPVEVSEASAFVVWGGG